MKAELKDLLSQPLLAKGISAKYITSGARPIADDLLAGQCKCAIVFRHLCLSCLRINHCCAIDNETMLGLKKAEAGSEVAAVKQKKKAKVPKAAVKKEEMEEEWRGASTVE